MTCINSPVVHKEFTIVRLRTSRHISLHPSASFWSDIGAVTFKMYRDSLWIEAIIFRCSCMVTVWRILATKNGRLHKNWTLNSEKMNYSSKFAQLSIENKKMVCHLRIAKIPTFSDLRHITNNEVFIQEVLRAAAKIFRVFF